MHDLVVAVEPQRETFAIQNFLPDVAVDQEPQLFRRRCGTVLLLVRRCESAFHRRIDDDVKTVRVAAGAPLRQQQQHQANREKVRERFARNSRERISCTPLEARCCDAELTHIPGHGDQSRFTRNVAPYARGEPGNSEYAP